MPNCTKLSGKHNESEGKRKLTIDGKEKNKHAVYRNSPMKYSDDSFFIYFHLYEAVYDADLSDALD